MEKRKLIEMGTLSRGRSQHRPRNDSKLYGGKYPFIQTGDVKNSNFYIEKYSQTYNDFGLNQSKLWPENTLCITIAANIADTGILSFPACFPDSIIGFTATKGKTDVRYVKYCFDLLQKSIQNMSKGSTQDNLSMEKLEQLEFNCPSFESQQKIAAVLSSLDDKIALNNRINAKLEQMAKRLYDYWFVQFDFPVSCHSELVSESHSEEMLNQVQHDECAKPYKSTGGKMDWNEELKREIPEGWEVKSIFDAADVIYGFPYVTEPFDENVEESNKPYSIIRIRDILENSISAKTTESVDDKYKTKIGDLLIGMDGYFHMNFWSRDNDYVNQRIVRIRKKDVSTLILYHQVLPFIKFKEEKAKGSTVGHLSDKDMKQIKVLIPNNKDLNVKFDTILSMMMARRQENLKLTAVRDKLLPLLMNGQVVVK